MSILAVERWADGAPAPWGLMTLEGERRLRMEYGHAVRVLLDGHDVTHRCVTADDRQGWALLIVHDEAGDCWTRRIETGQVEVRILDLDRALFNPAPRGAARPTNEGGFGR